MAIKEIEVKSALHYHDTKFASNYDLNIYRGCEHRCEYCFAQYSHEYLESDFFNDIFVKTNIAEILDKELTKKPLNDCQINICGVCDCYQPFEEKYQLMPQILKVLIKHKQPVFILTKSPLILRDYDLIKELAEKTNVCISATVTTLNEEIRKKIEPHTFPSIERIKAIGKFATTTKCETNIMLMPIIPYLTDSIYNIEEIYKTTKSYGIKNIIPGPLHLRGNLKKNFYKFLSLHFPDTYKNIQHLYKNAYISKDYSQKLNNFLLKMKKKYNLYSYQMPDLQNNVYIPKQLDLFDKQ